MNNKERCILYTKIAGRAMKLGTQTGDFITILMDIESADLKFNLRLDEWLKADDFNFMHDIHGIQNSIARNGFPSTTDFGLFVPRFASPN